MIGEAPVLLMSDRIITSLPVELAGRYAAFLFIGYAALLTFAVVSTFNKSSAGRSA